MEGAIFFCLFIGGRGAFVGILCTTTRDLMIRSVVRPRI